MTDPLAEVQLLNGLLLSAAELLTPESHDLTARLLGDIAAAGVDPLTEHRILTAIKRRTKLPLAELRTQLAQHAANDPSSAPEHPPWWNHLTFKRDGTPHPNAENVLAALHNAPEWRGVFGMSDFDHRAWLRSSPPWQHGKEVMQHSSGSSGYSVSSSRNNASAPLAGADPPPQHGSQANDPNDPPVTHDPPLFQPRPMRDSDDDRVLVWMQEHGLRVEPAAVRSALAVVLDEHRWHPVREWMRSLVWDGEVRCEDWLHRSLGVSPIADYTDRIAAAWLISGVARIMQPGCLAKYVLVLEGLQDLGKSQALAILGGEWFSDDIEALGSKDSKLQVGSALVIELPELDSIHRSQISSVKAFISRRVDRFRPPYGRHLIDAPRQSIFAATTNDQEWLADDTGGVRFWPVRCDDKRVDLDWLTSHRDQLWAEAVARYEAGERWWYDDQPAVAVAREEQAARIDYDAWEEKIRQWLDGMTETTTYEVMTRCLEMTEARDQSRGVQQRIARILHHRLGWRACRNATRRWYERRR